MSIQQTIADGQIIAQVQYLTRTYVLLIKRNSYLYIHLARILAFFQLNPDDGWYLSTDAIEVPWNLPVDVIYTTSKINLDGALLLQLIKSPRTTKPLHQLSSHMQLMQPQISELSTFFHKQWRNTIKQACYILNGTANQVMSMSIAKSNEFYESAINHNYKLFAAYANSITPKVPKNLPIKVYNGKWKHYSVLRTFATEFNEQTTLRDIVTSIKDNASGVIIHGIRIPLEAPIIEVYNQLRYFDLFLYITIV